MAGVRNKAKMEYGELRMAETPQVRLKVAWAGAAAGAGESGVAPAVAGFPAGWVTWMPREWPSLKVPAAPAKSVAARPIPPVGSRLVRCFGAEKPVWWGCPTGFGMEVSPGKSELIRVNPT